MTVPSPYLTVDDMVDSVIRAARLPISQVTFTTDDIIAFLDEEEKTTISSLIHSVREEYWLTNYDQAITVGQSEYGMPPRAVAGGLRDVVFLDASGNEIEMAHLDPDQLKTPPYFVVAPTFRGQGFFIRNDKVVLFPPTYNNTAYELREKYERRPNTLTSDANCVTVASINVGTNQITLSASPPGWVAGQLIDVIDNTPQFTSLNDNLLISGVSGSTLTIDASTPISSDITANMWACPFGTTCQPQIPVEAYPLLVQRGVMRIAIAMQNSNMFQVAAKLAEDSAAHVVKMLTPRVEGSPKKLVNRRMQVGRFNYPFFR